MSTLMIWLLLVAALTAFLYFDYNAARRFFDNTGGRSADFTRWWISESVAKLSVVAAVLVVVTLALALQNYTLTLPDFAHKIRLPRMILWGLLASLPVAAFVLFDLFIAWRFYQNDQGAEKIGTDFLLCWLRKSALKFSVVATVGCLALGGVWATRQYNLLQAKSETSGFMAGAQRYYEAKKYREASLELRNAIKQNQGDYEAYLWLGRTSWRLGALTEARDASREALRIEPKLYAAQLELGRLALALKDPDTALNAGKQALLLQPDAPEPGLLLARLYTLTGKHEQSLAQCRNIMGKKFADPEMQQQFLQLLMSERAFAEALQATEFALKETPNDMGLKLLRADALVGLGRTADAEGVLRSAATAAPNSAPPCMALADLLLLRGEQRDAIAWYEEALKRDPDEFRAMNNVATLTSRSGFNLDRAANLAARLYAHSPDNPDVADTLGWTLFLQGKTGEALPLLKQAAAQKPASPLHHYHLGAALMKNGNQAAGKNELAGAFRLSGNFYGADKARALLRL